MLSIKFGGTSMGSKESIKNVLEIINKDYKEGLIVTVSAMSGVTNKLLKLAERSVNKGEIDKNLIEEIKKQHDAVIKEIIDSAKIQTKTSAYISKELKKLKYFLEAIAITSELTPKSHDIIMALGEKFSACMLAAILNDKGIKAKYINLENLIKKNYKYADPKFFQEAEKKIRNKLKKHLEEEYVTVCTGFFGKVPGGILESVGRGYSDFTCALAGASLKVREIQIWTDVDGMLSADPRIVKEAHIIEKLSFKEASELAHFGAKILHPQTIHPAVLANVPVRILNTFNPKNKGTLVVPHEVKSEQPFKSIAVKRTNTIVRICSSRMLMRYGFLAKVFNVFEKYKISLDLIATSEVNISISIENHPKELDDVVKELKSFGTVYTYPNQTIISIIGQEVTHNTKLVGDVFSAIEGDGIDIKLISQGASQINLSFMVEDSVADDVVQIVHKTICKKFKTQ